MLESMWLFIGRVAFVWTLLVVGGAVYLDARDDGLAIVGGIIGFVMWGVWTFGTLNVEVVDAGVVYEFSSPAATLLGIALALVPGYIALTGPIEIIDRAADTRLEDI